MVAGEDAALVGVPGALDEETWSRTMLDARDVDACVWGGGDVVAAAWSGLEVVDLPRVAEEDVGGGAVASGASGCLGEDVEDDREWLKRAQPVPLSWMGAVVLGLACCVACRPSNVPSSSSAAAV